MLQLTEEELIQTFRRAEEIAEHLPDSSSPDNSLAQYDLYIRTAEELGIPQAAILQALREKHFVPTENFKIGDIVFAPSTDNALYPATITRIDDEGQVIVRFVSGGDQSISSGDVRSLSLVPGRSIQVEYSAIYEGVTGMWQNVKIVAFDAESLTATVSWNTLEITAPLAKLRIPPAKVKAQVGVRPLLIKAILIAGGLGTGLGFLLGHFLKF